MAKSLTRQELLAYARVGAQARIAELRRELAALEAAFDRKGRGAKAAGDPKSSRRKMSAEGRQKISAAAKLRWAKWRANKKK